MSVRIELWMAQLCCNSRFKSFGDEVFKAFRFVMHLVPGVIEDLMQECLDQAMMPHDLKSSLSPCLR